MEGHDSLSLGARWRPQADAINDGSSLKGQGPKHQGGRALLVRKGAIRIIYIMELKLAIETMMKCTATSACPKRNSGFLQRTKALIKFPLFLCGNDGHKSMMTQLLEQAFERVRALPPDQQDEFARVLLRLAGDDDVAVYHLTPKEEADLIEAEAEIERGEIATDAEVVAVFSKYRL